jgi:hypothetical protein
MKIKKLYSDDNPDYVQLVIDNPEIDFFVTIYDGADIYLTCDINYACNIFYPFCESQPPIFISVKKIVTGNAAYPFKIEYSLIFKFNKSIFSQFTYTLTYNVCPSRTTHNYYKLEYMFLNTGESTTIFDMYYYPVYKVNNDESILGFLKASRNIKYFETPSCPTCKYYNSNLQLRCAVRPGYDKLCDDFVFKNS